MNEAVTGPGLMSGRRGLIMGVANERSIAWSIAAAIAKEGGELAFTYQNDSIAKRVRPLAASVGSDFVLQCDVGNDARKEKRLEDEAKEDEDDLDGHVSLEDAVKSKIMKGP